ncbi:hypothetical protein RHSIM_Rhsim12G0206100 [Rhododendron simsii]|uniref:RNase H type-1 domain-containing protein n=1 Tax=Rhododendron simsii TaxID=118357 RepID=A0A834G7P5_RHOSS|nr:hypothetical protein RHSIM_Rhsim12G0206100 [Rhododendron simsii]
MCVDWSANVGSEGRNPGYTNLTTYVVVYDEPLQGIVYVRVQEWRIIRPELPKCDEIEARARIFDVADGISGYTPTLYTEVIDDNNFRQEVRGSQSNSLPIHRSTQRSHRPNERDPSKQQFLGDDTCFAYDMHDDSTIFEQHNDYVEHDSAFDNNLGDDDEVSQSSEEDVDEGLEAEDREEHEIPEFETPSSMFTDDTWTNIVDPSPQMPNKSHVGWDGHCELFKGQLGLCKLLMGLEIGPCRGDQDQGIWAAGFQAFSILIEGVIIGAAIRSMGGNFSPRVVEAMGFQFALTAALEQSLKQNEVEGDAKQVVQAINSERTYADCDYIILDWKVLPKPNGAGSKMTLGKVLPKRRNTNLLWCGNGCSKFRGCDHWGCYPVNGWEFSPRVVEAMGFQFALTAALEQSLQRNEVEGDAKRVDQAINSERTYADCDYIILDCK